MSETETVLDIEDEVGRFIINHKNRKERDVSSEKKVKVTF